MKFRFLSHRKKTSTIRDAARAKMSRICCLHTSTDAEDVIHTSTVSDTEDSSDGSSKSDHTTNKSVDVLQPLRYNPSSPSQGSTMSSISPLDAIVSDPRERATSRQSKDLNELYDQFGFTASPNVSKGDSYCRERDRRGTSSVCSYSPSMGSSSGRSSRKGPGLGSVSDNPPSRMLMETSTPDISALRLQNDLTKREEATGATAPNLPTRLEVCGGSARGEQPALCDSVVSMHSDKLNSHPVVDSASTRGSSGSPEVAQLSYSRERHVRDDRGTDNDSRLNSGKVSPHSPGLLNHELGESASKTLSPEQPTKLTAEADWEFRELVSRKATESSKGQCEFPQEESTEGVGIRTLHQWDVYLKLNWVSEISDDLVAEVYPIEDSSIHVSSKTPPHSFVSVSGVFKVRENALQAKTSAGDGIGESEIGHFVNSVMHELKAQRRSKGKDSSSAKGSLHHTHQTVDAIDDLRLGRDFRTKHIDNPNEQEFEPFTSSTSDRFHRRLEVLNAFEALVSRMEYRMRFSEQTKETGDMSFEKGLSAAILNDLKQETTRLNDRLCILNMAQETSFGEAPLAQLPSEPKLQMLSASLRDPENTAGFLERSTSNGDHRPHSAFETTTQLMTPQRIQKRRTVHGSAPFDYHHSPSSQQFHLAKSKSTQKDETNERFAKMTLLTEETDNFLL